MSIVILHNDTLISIVELLEWYDINRLRQINKAYNNLIKLYLLKLNKLTLIKITFSKALIPLEFMQSLYYLDLNNNPIKDDGIKYLLNLRNLKYLDVSSTLITHNGGKCISFISSLTTLKISYNKQIKGTGLIELSKLRNLINLTACVIGITDEDLFILDNMTSLNYIKISFNDNDELLPHTYLEFEGEDLNENLFMELLEITEYCDEKRMEYRNIDYTLRI